MRPFLLLALLGILSAPVWAGTKTCVVIGDSIMSVAAGGKANSLALTLVQNERDVVLRNISSPGASLAAADVTGFNSGSVLESLDRIGGMFSAYDCIIVQAVTNDFSRSASWGDTVASLRRILGHVRATGKRAMVMDAIWRADESIPNAAGSTLNTYRYFVYFVCAHEFADVCHFASRLNTPMGTSAGSANYDAAEIAKGKQLHPNAAGHRLLADWIIAEAGKAGLF